MGRGGEGMRADVGHPRIKWVEKQQQKMIWSLSVSIKVCVYGESWAISTDLNKSKSNVVIDSEYSEEYDLKNAKKLSYTWKTVF